MTVDSKTIDDLGLCEAILDRVATNLSMLIDREIKVGRVKSERASTRPAGEDLIHISFKLGYRRNGDDMGYGCLLVPLPEAIAMACYLMMLPEKEVEVHRSDETLDESMREALVELCGFIASATEEAIRVHDPDVSVACRGCQGVRADVRPAFPYEEGSPLVVARSKVKLHEGEEFQLLLMLPPPLG